MLQPPPRAFVLLMTLVILAFAATVATGLALQCVRKAVAVQRLSDDLQRRWAVRSCSVHLFPAAEFVLDEESRIVGASVALAQRKVTLGGMKVDLLFTDEQSKVNLNALLSRSDLRAVDHAVRRLIPKTGPAPTVELAPSRKDKHISNVLHRRPRFHSYRQIFPDLSPSSLASPLSSPAKELTCWGDGRINFRRASSTAIEAACTPLLSAGHVIQLTEMRDQNPEMGISDALNHLALPLETRQRLMERLTVNSNCHGMWITCHDTRRSWYTFRVLEVQSGITGSRSWTFAW